jgi:flagellar biosynthesis protein FlhG
LDKVVLDQAEGLRRLLARAGARVVSVVSGSSGAGRTTVAANLASALAQQGKDVLVIDESGGSRNAARALGATPHGTLARVLAGDMPLEAAVGRSAHGVAVLPASRGSQSSFTAAELDAVLDAGCDIVFIDAMLDLRGTLSPLAMRAHDVMLVARLHAQSITDTYACMKRLHFAHAVQQFRVLTNAVQHAPDAKIAFDNLAHVANRYLGVALDNAGAVSFDARVARAFELGRSAVDAFPMTQAARDFRQTAAELLYWPMRPAISRRVASGEAPNTYCGERRGLAADKPSMQTA